MREVELGAHTLKSHGSRVARTHLHDWLILLLLGLIEIILYIMHPFNRYVGQDMMTDLKYPMKENTVPVWAVPVSFFLTLIIIFYECVALESHIISSVIYSFITFLLTCCHFYDG